MFMREVLNAKAARQAPSILFVVAIPLLMITAAVTWALNDLSLYKYGFDKYDVPLVTGIERDDLVSVGAQLRGYFNSTTEPLDIRAPVFGEETDIFNQREIIHMHDVKRLVWGVYGIGAASGVYILGFLAFGLLKRREQLYGSLARYALWGSGLTVGIVVLVGLGSLLGFDSLFRGFHEVAFYQRLLAVRLKERPAGDDVPRGLLVRRHDARRSLGRGTGCNCCGRDRWGNGV